MAKPEWGSKRICQSCATKYYDLGRSPIVCPKCDAVFQPVTLLKSRRNRAPAAAKSHRPAPARPDKAGVRAGDAGDAKEAEIKTNGKATDPEAAKTDTTGDRPVSKVEVSSELGSDEKEAAKTPVKNDEAEG